MRSQIEERHHTQHCCKPQTSTPLICTTAFSRGAHRLLGLALVLVRRPRRRKPITIAGNEIPGPQPAKSLVANDIRIRVKIRHDTLQISAPLGRTRIPEPELAYHDRQTLDAWVLGLQGGHIRLDVGFEG